MFNKLRILNNEDTNDKNVYIIFILKGKRQRIKMTSRDVKYSLGKKVNNIVVVTTYGVRGVYRNLGRILCKVYDCLNPLIYI